MRFYGVATFSLVVALLVPTALVGCDSSEKPSGAATTPVKGMVMYQGKPLKKGTVTFEPDGAYVWRNFGPAGMNSAGKWEVRWDALPATLILNCKTSDDDDDVGKALELKITQLDESTFSYKFNTNQPAASYLREKKK